MADNLDAQLDKAQRAVESAQARVKRLKKDKLIRDLKRENEALRQSQDNRDNRDNSDDVNRLIDRIQKFSDSLNTLPIVNVKLKQDNGEQTVVQTVRLNDVQDALKKLVNNE